jgi:hypothetical protein
MQVYAVRPRKDKRGVDLISDALPFGRLWYGEPGASTNAIGYARFFSRLQDAVIRVDDDARNVIETNEHAGDFKESMRDPWLRGGNRYSWSAPPLVCPLCLGIPFGRGPPYLKSELN